MTRRGVGQGSVALGLVALSLTACATEYHGGDSGIDSALWWQIAGIEDPLSQRVHQSQESEPAEFVDSLRLPRWDGAEASADGLGLADGGGVIYDVALADEAAALSVFISSGLRATDTDETYSGPSAVYTCHTLHAEFGNGTAPTVQRLLLDQCPAPLVEAMPDGAAFASGEVFDG